MPGSNQYSQLSGIPETTKSTVTKSAVTKPTLYKPQDWETKAKQEKFGTTELNARQQRRFNRWQNKDAQVQDRLAFDRGEQNKLLNSMDAMRDARVAGIRAARDTQLAKLEAAKPAVITKPEGDQGRGTPPLKPKPKDWLAEANAAGTGQTFKTIDEVKAFQNKIGTKADGMFGPKSVEAYKTWKAQQDSLAANQSTTPISYEELLTMPYFRKSLAMGKNFVNTLDGYTYPLIQTGSDISELMGKGMGEGMGIFKPNTTYAYDPSDGYMREVVGHFYNGIDRNASNELNSKWFDATPYLSELFQRYNINVPYRKQGGTMNKINYFQQGGAAPQPSMEDQVIALVQAAMQGDQQATQTIEQIMQAAQSGDQQATQIAQMIQQVMQQMQGQATSAKWGAKLGYIRSLKYAKGGKTCPDCEKKKVKVEACGGKAKKRYFGGLV